MTRNMLDQETSPYLLRHKDNPVHWRTWSPEALAEAEEQGKPILLSVGYSACHWCHVMEEESFSAIPKTAAQMNELLSKGQYQGRSRGAPRHRSHLSDGGPGAGPRRRLAADDVPHPAGRSARWRAPISSKDERPGQPAFKRIRCSKQPGSIASSPEPRPPTPPRGGTVQQQDMYTSPICGHAICAARWTAA